MENRLHSQFNLKTIGWKEENEDYLLHISDHKPARFQNLHGAPVENVAASEKI